MGKEQAVAVSEGQETRKELMFYFLGGTTDERTFETLVVEVVVSFSLVRVVPEIAWDVVATGKGIPEGVVFVVGTEGGCCGTCCVRIVDRMFVEDVVPIVEGVVFGVAGTPGGTKR